VAGSCAEQWLVIYPLLQSMLVAVVCSGTHGVAAYSNTALPHPALLAPRDHLLNLLHPAGTVMDLNIGAALWLAVGATGTLRLPQQQAGSSSAPGPPLPDSPQLTTGQPYTSGARVVLLGHGADEQCAGYGRHRTRWVWQAGVASLLACDTCSYAHCAYILSSRPALHTLVQHKHTGLVHLPSTMICFAVCSGLCQVGPRALLMSWHSM
jgi:hypothetical protein